MRRSIVFALVLMLAGMAWADDALVLPQGVLRVYVAPAYGFATETFDQDGERQSLDNDVSLFNLGFAVEYGLTDQISVAAQWVPGYTLWSKIDPEPAPLGTATVNGPFDLFVGAKVQVMGPKAFVPNENMRLAFAPGVVIPMPGASAEDELEKLMDDEPYVIQELDLHAWGIGARAYFDFVVTESFFVNLYGEFIYFLEKEYDDSVNYGNFTVNHGYSLTLEAEPQYEAALAEGIKGSVGLAATLNMTPEMEIEGTTVDDSDSHVLSLRPNLGLFLMNTPVPLEFKATYNLPLLGKNVPAMNMFVLECRVYLKF